MKRVFSITTFVVVFLVLGFSSCEKQDELILVDESDNTSSELFKNWLDENVQLVDVNYVDDEGYVGCLYETPAGQQIFIPISNSQKKHC